MSYAIIRQSGWYGIETDEIRKYQWASDMAMIHIGGDISKFKFLIMNVGSSQENRHIKIIGNDGNTFEFFTKNGWYKYVIPLGNSRFFSIDSEVMSVPGDNRRLGIQVGDIVLSSTDVFVWTIENLKSKWIDIVYTLYNNQRSEIKVKFKNTEKKFLILGGQRTLSFELNDCDIENNNISFEIFKKETDNLIVTSIINRKDYYDYMGLKSSNYYDEESRKSENECIRVASTIPLSIQWFVNWKCNFHCDYCWQETSKELYRTNPLNKIPWKKWADAFNYYKPGFISITGGEPTLYSDLPEFINGLDVNIGISMTTNGGPSFDIEKWKRIVSPHRVWDISFSLHPTQWKNINDFYDTVDSYVDFFKPGYVGIEMVSVPENLKLVSEESLQKWCNDRKINCRIEPCFVATKHIPLIERTDPTERINLENTKTEYNDYIQYTSIGGEPHIPFYCPSGWKRINVDYKGDVFTCMSAIDRSKLFDEHSMPHYTPMGNIFNENFKLRDKPILCWEAFRCARCDSIKVDSSWRLFSNNVNVQLPVAE